MNTPLILAVKEQDVELVKELVERKDVDIQAVNAKNWTAMMYALLRGNVEIIRILIEKGDTFTEEQLLRVRDRDSVWEAAYLGKLERVKFFLETLGVSSEEIREGEGFTPLYKACQGGHLSIVKYLVEKGKADPMKGCCLDLSTPLMVACKKNRYMIVEYLLTLDSVKENVDVRNKDGWTALMFASRYGSLESAQLLFSNSFRQPDPNVLEYKFRNSCVMFACRYGFAEIVSLLVKKGGADIEIPDSKGYTCLMRAVQYGHDNVVELLVRKLGANVWRKTQSNVCVRKIVEKTGNDFLFKILYCADTDAGQHGPISRQNFRRHDMQYAALISRNTFSTVSEGCK